MTAHAQKEELLARIPSITDLLKRPGVVEWQRMHSLALVTDCLRRAAAELRQRVLEGATDQVHAGPVTAEAVLERARTLLVQATTPRICQAINATGVILHTGLGRAVFPPGVVDSIVPELKGYTALAMDRGTGERIERDELVEYVLTELTGAEAATVVNNNAAATMLVLAALAAHREVIVSRGQLIEIGGSFRLPEVMAQSQARLVEVGATNRTHLRDYRRALTDQSAAIMRVHPSNYRVIGFTSEVALPELGELAHTHNLILIDDLGAGALLDLRSFGLPHEPTARESIEAGADVVLFSGDKLIGASQCGIIVGRKPLLDRIRHHPLMRAMRADKTCLMILERTLHLFRHPDRLVREHPTYQMIATPLEALRARAGRLQAAVAALSSAVATAICDTAAFVGSGSLPTEALPSVAVTVSAPDLSASELARRLRLDPACVFGRVEGDLVHLDLRTVTDAQVQTIAEALARICRRDPPGVAAPAVSGAG